MPVTKSEININKFGCIVCDAGFSANAWRHFSNNHLWKVDLFRQKNRHLKKTTEAECNPLVASFSVVADDEGDAVRRAIRLHKRDILLSKKYYDIQLKEKEERDKNEKASL